MASSASKASLVKSPEDPKKQRASTGRPSLGNSKYATLDIRSSKQLTNGLQTAQGDDARSPGLTLPSSGGNETSSATASNGSAPVAPAAASSTVASADISLAAPTLPIRKSLVRSGSNQTFRPSLPNAQQNTRQSMPGNAADSVKVYCRFRPTAASTAAPFHLDTASSSVLLADSDAANSQYSFDAVFADSSTQSDVFEECGRSLCGSVMEGYNSTVLAYGQTGAGKTHTMMGSDTAASGFIPSMIHHLFALIEQSATAIEYTVKAAMVEIYNEKVRDLLTTSNDAEKSNLKLREGTDKVVTIEGVEEVYCSTADEVINTLNDGLTNRVVTATAMNAQSSRSHVVFQVMLRSTNRDDGSKKYSKLTCVDLAGSERQTKAETSGITLTEANHINKSLSQLGLVIKELTESQTHVSYRASKLTRLLQDSLGGNSKTTLICCCSNTADNYEETLSTLRFGVRAKHIKNQPRVNTELSIKEYKQQLQQAQQKIAQQALILQQYEQELQQHSTHASTTMQSSSTAMAAALQHLQTKADEYEHLNAVLHNKLEVTKDKLNAVESEHQSVADTQISLQAEVAALQVQLATAIQSQQAAESQLVQTQLNSVKQETAVKDRDAEIQHLQQQLQEMQLQLTVINSSPARREERRKSLSTQFTSAELQSMAEELTSERTASAASSPAKVIHNTDQGAEVQRLRNDNTRLLQDLQHKIEQTILLETNFEDLRESILNETSSAGSTITNTSATHRIEALNRSLMQENQKLRSGSTQSLNELRYNKQLLENRNHIIESLESTVWKLQIQLKETEQQRKKLLEDATRPLYAQIDELKLVVQQLKCQQQHRRSTSSTAVHSARNVVRPVQRTAQHGAGKPAPPEVPAVVTEIPVAQPVSSTPHAKPSAEGFFDSATMKLLTPQQDENQPQNVDSNLLSSPQKPANPAAAPARISLSNTNTPVRVTAFGKFATLGKSMSNLLTNSSPLPALNTDAAAIGSTPAHSQPSTPSRRKSLTQRMIAQLETLGDYGQPQ